MWVVGRCGSGRGLGEAVKAAVLSKDDDLADDGDSNDDGGNDDNRDDVT